VSQKKLILGGDPWRHLRNRYSLIVDEGLRIKSKFWLTHTTAFASIESNESLDNVVDLGL
jgi:hypothetical protein